jgi:cytochrome P450
VTGVLPGLEVSVVLGLGFYSLARVSSAQSDGICPIETIGTIDDQLIAELLRLDGPAQAVMRTATHDHVLGDIAIQAGESALVVLAAPNRDPTVFNDADQLHPDRLGPTPLAFGSPATRTY